MPLMKGKSQGAFKSNVKSEMHSGKPQKQALAIAYAVKKRAGKKMAKGGEVPAEDMGREYFKPHEGAQTDDQNEDFTPQNSPEHGAEDAVLGQMRLKRDYQSYGVLPEDKQSPPNPNKIGNPIHPADKIADRKMPLAEQGAHMAMGGEIKSAMSRRERALYAARGKPIRPDDGYAHVSAGVVDSPNEGASRNTGPSGMTTRMPLTAEGVANGPPSSDKISPEEQAMFAKGGPVAMMAHHKKMAAHYENMSKMPKMADGGYAEPKLDMEEQGAFYDRGGIAMDSSGGNEISSPRPPYANLKEDYAKPPFYAKEEEGERFASGGMAGNKDDMDSLLPMLAKGGIASAIMKKKMYGEGGPVDRMGLQDQETDEDRFLSQNMPQTNYSHITTLDDSDQTEYEDPKQKRKTMLSRIMQGLHKEHYAKE